MNIQKEIDYIDSLKDMINAAENPWDDNLPLSEFEQGYIRGLKEALNVFTGK